MFGALIRRLRAWWRGDVLQQCQQGVWWQTTPSWAFYGGLSPHELLALRNLPTCRLVKANLARRIYRLSLGAEWVYLKESRVVGWRGWLRECLRLPKARLEFENSLRLQNLGIATIEPLAWGCESRWWPGTSYFLSRGLPQAVTLRDFLTQTFTKLPPRRQIHLRRHLAQSLGALLAQMHEQGVIHSDLHPGNLLLDMTEEHRPRLILVDLHNVQFQVQPLSWPASRTNLVLLNRWFQLRTHRTDRLRFWQAYCRGRLSWAKLSAAEKRRRIAEVEVSTLRSNQRLWLARRKRYSRPNRHCQRVIQENRRGLAVRELPAVIVQYWMQQVDAWIDQARQAQAPAPGWCSSQEGVTIRLLKDGPEGTVLAVQQDGLDGPGEVVIKRFGLRRWYEVVQHLLRCSAVWRAWFQGFAVLDRGLPTPRPLAIWHRCFWGLPTHGYLVTEYLPDAVPLQKRPDLVRLDLLACVLRLLHDRGLCHRDLKGDNILVTAQGEPVLIDLVGVRSLHSVSIRRRIKDLMRLNVSFLGHHLVRNSQRLRFLRAYASYPPALWSRSSDRIREWKKWWKRIKQKSLEKLKRWKRSQ